MKIIGMKDSIGEYEGHAYNNVVLYCTLPDEKVSGLKAQIVKIKSESFVMSGVKLGDEIDVLYDEWGKAKKVVKV